MIKFVKYFIQAIFIYFFFFIGKLFGLRLSRRIFSLIFRSIGPVIKSKKIMKKNLLNFSSKISNKKIMQISSNMWANYGMTFIEYMFLKDFKKGRSHIQIKGEKILKKISVNNKPVIFVSGHFANFELMSMEIVKKKIKLATIYRPLNNFFLNPTMEYLRKKFVCSNQIKKGRMGIKKIIEYLNSKHSIALMIDQRVTEGEKIDFFNKKAFTTTLPAQLALKNNLQIVPIFIERKDNDFFEMEVFQPVEVSKYKDKHQISKKLNKILEGMIKKNPNQWIWTHNRWK